MRMIVRQKGIKAWAKTMIWQKYREEYQRNKRGIRKSRVETGVDTTLRPEEGRPGPYMILLELSFLMIEIHDGLGIFPLKGCEDPLNS